MQVSHTGLEDGRGRRDREQFYCRALFKLLGEEGRLEVGQDGVQAPREERDLLLGKDGEEGAGGTAEDREAPEEVR